MNHKGKSNIVKNLVGGQGGNHDVRYASVRSQYGATGRDPERYHEDGKMYS